MKKLLVIGESLPLPTDELRYEDTWVYRIAREVQGIWVIDKCVRGRSVTTLMHGGPYGQAKNLYEWYKPACIVIHLGLTDCAPRLLPHKALVTKIINRMPFSDVVYNWLRKHRGRRIEYADVSPDVFFENLNGYCEKVFPHIVGIIKISRVMGNALKRSQRFNDSISLYNSVIDRVCQANANAVSIEGLVADDIRDYQSDGMHLTASGQDKILMGVKNFLRNNFSTSILPPPIIYKEMIISNIAS